MPPNYTVIEAEGDITNPLEFPFGRNIVFHRWETNNPGVRRAFTDPKELADEDSSRLRSAPLFRGDDLYTRHWLAAEWLPYAGSEHDMARLLKYLFDQNVRGEFDGRRGLNFAQLTQGAIVQSLSYVQRPNAAVMTDAIKEALVGVSPEKREALIAKIYPALGKVLLRAPVHAKGAHAVIRDIANEEIVQAIEFYDEAGLVGEKFWTSFGVDATAAIITPEFAPLLVEKLNAPDGEGERLIREYVPYPERAARAYITRVFEAYSNDPDRIQRNVANMLNKTLPGKKQAGTTVDARTLIKEANRMSTAHNRRIDARGGDPTRKLTPLPVELPFVSDAFLRMLALTRSADMPRDIQVAQWEQDVNHAEIIGIILGQEHKRTISDADSALQFPNLDAKQRALVRRMMRGNAGELLRALQEQQAQPDENPKHPGTDKKSPYPEQ